VGRASGQPCCCWQVRTPDRRTNPPRAPRGGFFIAIQPVDRSRSQAPPPARERTSARLLPRCKLVRRGSPGPAHRRTLGRIEWFDPRGSGGFPARRFPRPHFFRHPNRAGRLPEALLPRRLL